jgi:hypothetical protein
MTDHISDEDVTEGLRQALNPFRQRAAKLATEIDDARWTLVWHECDGDWEPSHFINSWVHVNMSRAAELPEGSVFIPEPISAWFQPIPGGPQDVGPYRLVDGD